MSEALVIAATPRSKMGKNYARVLRRAGKVPGVLCRGGMSTPIELSSELISKVYKAGRKCQISLNGTTENVYVQEIQVDHVTRAFG